MRTLLRLTLILAFALVGPRVQAGDGRLETLARTIEARLGVMEDVAHYKWLHHIPVEAPAREAAVIGATVKRATSLGLNKAVATRAVTAQMEAAKALQQQLIKIWENGQALPDGAAPDLTADIRPKINRLTGDFLSALKGAAPLLERCEAAMELKRPDSITPEVWHIAVSGLRPEGCDQAARPKGSSMLWLGSVNHLGPFSVM